jgi:uncharacterized RDD family membrane protein YckC
MDYTMIIVCEKCHDPFSIENTGGFTHVSCPFCEYSNQITEKTGLAKRTNGVGHSKEIQVNERGIEYAGFWIRVWASIIDTLIEAVIVLPILYGVYGEDYFYDTNTWVHGPIDFLLSWVLPAFAVITFWAYKSATPGKMIIQAKIVDAHTGGKPTLGQFVGRYFAYFVSIIPLGLGIFWVAFDRRKQGWHDKLAGTVVICKKYSTPEPVRFNQQGRG